MSFDLINPSTQITKKFSKQTWAKALELALIYDWRPMGTCPPPHLDFQQLETDWDGRYLTNDGQIMKAQDALFVALDHETQRCQSTPGIAQSIGYCFSHIP